jgi:hypothetical protein
MKPGFSCGGAISRELSPVSTALISVVACIITTMRIAVGVMTHEMVMDNDAV